MDTTDICVSLRPAASSDECNQIQNSRDMNWLRILRWLRNSRSTRKNESRHWSISSARHRSDSSTVTSVRISNKGISMGWSSPDLSILQPLRRSSRLSIKPL
ncbi:hypothetical protein PGT21_004233 [Puccinia graminis f. sp. tritici]|uniref:Uncharacterized protein n=1 Tax=Puccinia graminis f. sp. tritici TaxID=56615 RepID=A0A5B0PWV8_PUCGR|nr:hypothetical protein PGT21_004233 [Puccinia graminis f. sp. tritici]